MEKENTQNNDPEIGQTSENISMERLLRSGVTLAMLETLKHASAHARNAQNPPKDSFQALAKPSINALGDKILQTIHPVEDGNRESVLNNQIELLDLVFRQMVLKAGAAGGDSDFFKIALKSQQQCSKSFMLLKNIEKADATIAHINTIISQK